MATDAMDEIEFIESIDACFPYDDTRSARVLIEQACAVSANAAFMVAHELARVPGSKRVSPDTLRELLVHLDAHLKHPLKDIVFRVVRTMIRGGRVSDAEVLALMDNIRAYPGQHNALSIVYFAAENGGDTVDSAFESITRAWGS
jgi:hypothetical protein